MDTETSGVIERINARIDALETTLRAEIRGSLEESKRFTQALNEGVRNELRAEIRGSLEESKRHAQILNEDVRDDIRMLAEAIASSSAQRDPPQR